MLTGSSDTRGFLLTPMTTGPLGPPLPEASVRVEVESSGGARSIGLLTDMGLPVAEERADNNFAAAHARTVLPPPSLIAREVKSLSVAGVGAIQLGFGSGPQRAEATAKMVTNWIVRPEQGTVGQGQVAVDVGVSFDGQLWATRPQHSRFCQTGPCQGGGPLGKGDLTASVSAQVLGHTRGSGGQAILGGTAMFDYVSAARDGLVTVTGDWVDDFSPVFPGRSGAPTAEVNYAKIHTGALQVPLNEIYAIEVILTTSASASRSSGAVADFFQRGAFELSPPDGVEIVQVDADGNPIAELVPDPNDQDGDRSLDVDDNCPDEFNPDQD